MKVLGIVSWSIVLSFLIYKIGCILLIADFNPAMNNFVKNNLFLIALGFTVILVIVHFHYFLKKFLHRFLLIAGLIVSLFLLFIRANFYKGYNEIILRELKGNPKICITRIDFPHFINICETKYRIVKKGNIFIKKHFDFPCTNSIDVLNENDSTVMLQINYKTFSEKSDTVLFRLNPFKKI